MEIFKKPNESFNFDQKLTPLFEAMKAGKTIKSITCYAGQVNKDNSAMDFTITDFIVEEYYVAAQSNHDSSKSFDWVITNKEVDIEKKKHGTFYMNWVKSFEL